MSPIPHAPSHPVPHDPEGLAIQVGRGRLRKHLGVGGTQPRSVRFPEAIWALLEERARAKGLTVHAAMREAIVAWLQRAA